MKTENRSAQVQNLALAALFMAAGLVLPFLTGQIPQIGSMLLPMHLPVLLVRAGVRLAVRRAGGCGFAAAAVSFVRYAAGFPHRRGHVL